MSINGLDPVTLTIINNGFVNVCREMGITMIRTAFSPIFNEGLDFSCVLFDRKGSMIGQAEFCPAQVAASLFIVRWTIEELERGAILEFEAQGEREAPREVRRQVAMRYQGQNYEQEVPVPSGPLAEDDLAHVYAEFGRLYEGFYGYRLDGVPIELVRLQVVIAGARHSLPDLPAGGGGAEESALRPVWFPERGFLETAVVRRESLAPAAALDGPLIVEEMDSTVVVPPGWRLLAKRGGVLELDRMEGGA